MMETMDNVCSLENGTGTEQTDAVSVNKENGSTGFGKFKDANALLKAYESLQAEFTRRSQRLKEMERAMDNREAVSAFKVEKLKKGAEARKRREREFDSFVEALENAASSDLENSESSAFKEKSVGQVLDESERPVVRDRESEPSLPSLQGMENSANEKEKTAVMVAKADGKVEDVAAELEGGEFAENKNLEVPRGGVKVEEYGFADSDCLYRLVCDNEEVRLRVVGDYLKSLAKPDAPIMKGGVGTLAAPLKKVSSIGEAGRMALRFFKKDGQA
jgi:hypothetical protein